MTRIYYCLSEMYQFSDTRRKNPESRLCVVIEDTVVSN